MLDDIYSNQITLLPNVEYTHNFPALTKMIFLENKSFEPIEIYWKNEEGEYNPNPIMINRQQSQTLKVRTDAIKSKSKNKAYLEVLSIIGDEDTNYVFVDKNTETPLLIDSFKQGEILREFVFNVFEAFDLSYTIAVGTISNEESLIRKNFVKTKSIAISSVELFTQFSEATDIYLFSYGSTSIGKMIVYIKEF